MNDRDNNQITAFHPGAMQQAHITRVAARDDIRLGIIAPDGRDAMLQHAEQFKAAGIPFVFDPGQGLPMFDGKELAHFVELAELGHGQRLRRQDAFASAPAGARPRSRSACAAWS